MNCYSRRIYCGNECHRLYFHSQEQRLARFWAQVQKTEGCWLWVGWVMSSGYGETCQANKRILAHRLSWKIANGEIPKGQLVLHKCDTPLCMRPSHLFLGTDADNTADKRAKDRHARGERSNRNKLTDDIVRQIKAEYWFQQTGRIKRSNAAELAARYGVGTGTIVAAVNGRAWTHVK